MTTWWPYLRIAAALLAFAAIAVPSTIVTCIVYNTLLRGVELPQGVTVPWSNEVMHVVIPLFLLADLLFAPRRRAALERGRHHHDLPHRLGDLHDDPREPHHRPRHR